MAALQPLSEMPEKDAAISNSLNTKQKAYNKVLENR